MNILVTGGTGFIGEHFIPCLIKQGHTVRLLVRNLEKAKALFKEECEYFIGDITKRESLFGCCEGIDIVFHMVAKVGNQLPSEVAFEEFRFVNVKGTQNILDEGKSANIKRFVFVSSIAAMGIVKETPINERSKCEPYLPYQVTKFEAEEIIRKEVCSNDFPGIIVRPTKVYGVGEHEYSYLTLAKLCKKGVFPKVGKGKNYTSNIYVTDLVQALVKLIDNGKIGETYILTSKESISFSDVGKCASQVIGKKIYVMPVPSSLMIFAATLEERFFNLIKRKPIVTRKNIEATITDRVYDISKAEDEIGFKPEVTMEEGIRKVVHWYVENDML